MTEVPIILAQLAPGAAVETDLIVVPSREKRFIAEIAVCNRVASPAKFRLSVSLLGAPTATKDYLYYDLTIDGNDTFATELNLTMDSLDAMRVYADTANLTFTVFGAKT